MPITYETAAPVAPGASAMAGAAEQFSKDQPALVAQQRNILSAGSEVQRALEQQAHYAAAMYAQQQQQAHAEMMQQQKVQQQAWLNEQEMTTADTMRLQRLQNAVGAVSTDTSLSDEEKHAMITQLQTGIDPLKQRQERQQQAMQEEAFKQLQRQHAQQVTLQNMNAQQLAAYADAHTHWFTTTNEQGATIRTGTGMHYDPVSGRTTVVHDSMLESRHEHALTMRQIALEGAQQVAQIRTQAAAAQHAAVREAHSEHVLPLGVMDERDWRAERKHAEDAFKDEVKEKYPAETSETKLYGTIQQFQDLTYRRNIQGRLRELHLDDYANYLRTNPLMRGHPAIRNLGGGPPPPNADWGGETSNPAIPGVDTSGQFNPGAA